MLQVQALPGIPTKDQMKQEISKGSTYLCGSGNQEPVEEELDPEIRPVVMILRECGLRTFTSCQGGPKHSFEYPCVRLAPDHELQEILAVLNGLNHHGFEVSAHYDYNGGLRFWHIAFNIEHPIQNRPEIRLSYAQFSVINGQWISKHQIRLLTSQVEPMTKTYYLASAGRLEDGPFETVDQAKEHMRNFDVCFITPEIGAQFLVVSESGKLDLYKDENGHVVTVNSVHLSG